MSRKLAVCALGCIVAISVVAQAAPVRIGEESVVSLNPRSEYCRYVNWRPADGETVALNPPRLSWPYRADWPASFADGMHMFTLEISQNRDCSEPVVDVETQCNFYNTIPALDAAKAWYWRVGYDVGSNAEQWSDVRSFRIAEDAAVWDRAALAPDKIRVPDHPRVLFNAENLERMRALADEDPGAAGALAYMRGQADNVLAKDWWANFPETDRDQEPSQAFYRIAQDLATVAFVWQMTGEEKYAGVVERAVTWASYPPGGRASPEGLGGDGNEDATQGNEFLALLFDWLYQDMSEDQREVMIGSLEWRVDHIMNRFSWRGSGANGPMLRITCRSSAKTDEVQAEAMQLSGGARIVEHEKAAGGKMVELATAEAAISMTVTLARGTYSASIVGNGAAPDKDAFRVAVDDQKPQRVFIQGWGDASVSLVVTEDGEHRVTISADPNEPGAAIDRLRITVHGDQRLKLLPSPEWKQFSWQIPVIPGADNVAVEPFNYYARGEVWYDSIVVSATDGGPNLLTNGDFSAASADGVEGWQPSQYRTESTLEHRLTGGRDGGAAVGIICPDQSDRGAWAQVIPITDETELFVSGWYRTGSGMLTAPVKASGMAGMISSHPFEGAMDTAVCGLVLREHSEIGREWFELCLNYLIGVTVGHGFDEGWNEGAGYGSSKCKWLMNATMYYDTALPEANLGLNPRYQTLAEWFCRIIPVGMDHHAWGNQRNASRGNHLAHMRQFAHLTGDGQFLYNWQQYGGGDYAKFRPWISYALAGNYEMPEPRPEAEFSRVYPIDGWAMSATGPPSDARTYAEGAGMIFQCRPRGGYGHSFNSDGSFQLHAYGQMLNHGGGSSANLDAFAYHTMSGTTVLVDGLGQAQPGRGMLYPAYGRIVGHAEGDDFFYVAGDPTLCYPKEPGNYARWGLPLDKVYQERALPYLERFVRHMVFVRGEYFVIYDDLRCSQPATYTWLYHIRPTDPIEFDAGTFAVDYEVGGVPVRLQHVYQPKGLVLDDRQGMDGYVNPITGEDYRSKKNAKWDPSGHHLWVSSAEPVEDWGFLAVVYPQAPGGATPTIERVDDRTVRVGDDVVCFDPDSAAAADATIVVDVAAFRPER